MRWPWTKHHLEANRRLNALGARIDDLEDSLDVDLSRVVRQSHAYRHLRDERDDLLARLRDAAAQQEKEPIDPSLIDPKSGERVGGFLAVPKREVYAGIPRDLSIVSDEWLAERLADLRGAEHERADFPAALARLEAEHARRQARVPEADR